MESATVFEDSFKLYQAVGGYMADNLFWSLTYLNAALFRNPNKQDIKQKLLSLYKMPEAIILYFYQTPAARELVRRLEANNRLFIVYVERCPVRQPSAREQARRQWVENGRQIARLMAQLNENWRQPEWSAMISQSIQMLSQIANQTVEGRYEALTETVPLCRRLMVDMSEYATKGLVEKHLV